MAEHKHKRHPSYNSQKQNFKLTHLEVQTLLASLEKNPGDSTTSTSLWNRPSSRRTAVYKLFKVTRWLLKDEDMIFDPLNRSSMVTLDSNMYIDDVCGLLKANPGEEDSSDQLAVQKICSLSVNRILSKYLTEKSAKSLREIYDVLSVLDMSTETDLSNEKKIAELVKSGSSTFQIKADEETAHLKARTINWLRKLIKYIILELSEKRQIPEESYSLIFEDFVGLVLQAVSESTDLYQVRSSTLQFGRRFEMNLRNLVVRSEADLYICHEEIVKHRFSDKDSLIAVVEVKSRDASGNVIHSSGTTTQRQSEEQECSRKKERNMDDSFVQATSKTADAEVDVTTGGRSHNEEIKCTKKKVKAKSSSKHVTISHKTSGTGSDDETDDSDVAEEEDKDFPDFDDIEETRIESAPNDNLRRMNQEEKFVLRHFLPQLLGELMCTFELPNPWGELKEYHGTYRLGVAVTGLVVYFVGLIIHHNDDNFPQHQTTSSKRNPLVLQLDEHLRTVAFLTRPLDILRREDRRIVIKTLASAALLTSKKSPVQRL